MRMQTRSISGSHFAFEMLGAIANNVDIIDYVHVIILGSSAKLSAVTMTVGALERFTESNHDQGKHH